MDGLQARGIELPEVPEGFERRNGVLVPIEKPKEEGIVGASPDDVQRVERFKTDTGKEARREWEERIGLPVNVFKSPDSALVSDKLFAAICRKANLKWHASFAANLTQQVLEVRKHPYEVFSGLPVELERAEARAFFAAASDLYRSYAPEFAQSQVARTSFFTPLFFFTKLGSIPEEADNLWSPHLIEFAVEQLPALPTSEPSYAIAKGLLKMNLERLGKEEIQSVLGTLARNQDLHTDLALLIAERTKKDFKELIPGYTAPDEGMWELAPEELVANAATYAKHASTEGLGTFKQASKVGYEFEFLQDGDNDTLSTRIATELKGLSVVDLRNVHADGSVTEMKTGERGVPFTRTQAIELLKLGQVLERNQHAVALASIHINLDYLHKRASAFDFANYYYDERCEFKGTRTPIARLDTPYLNEMSILLDETAVLGGLYDVLSKDDLREFVRRKTAGMPLSEILSPAFGPHELECEYLIGACQDSNQFHLVPAVLRLYAQNAVPRTLMAQEMLFAVEDSRETASVPWGPHLIQYFVRDMGGEVGQLSIAKALDSIPAEAFFAITRIMHRQMNKAFLLILVDKMPSCTFAQAVSTLQNPYIDSSVRKALIEKLEPISFTPEVRLFLSGKSKSGDSIEKNVRVALAQKIQNLTFAEAKEYLTDAQNNSPLVQTAVAEQIIDAAGNQEVREVVEGGADVYASVADVLERKLG